MNIINLLGLPSVPGMFCLMLEIIFNGTGLHHNLSVGNKFSHESLFVIVVILFTFSLSSEREPPLRLSSSSESREVPVLKRGPAVLVGLEMSVFDIR